MKQIFISLIIFVYTAPLIGQDLTGTWESQLEVAGKKYNSKLFVYKSEGNLYTGIQVVKDITSKLKLNLSSTGGRINFGINGLKAEPQPAASVYFIGVLNNNTFELYPISIIDKVGDLQNMRIEKYSCKYSIFNKVEKLTQSVEQFGWDFVKQNTSFPEDYSQYAKKSIISLNDISYFSKHKSNKITYSDQGNISFSIGNGSGADFSGVSIKLQVKEKNHDIQIPNQSINNITIQKGQSYNGQLSINTGFDIPKDSVQMLLTVLMDGVLLFDRNISFPTLPFYNVDRVTLSKNSDQVLSILKSYYGLDGNHYAAISNKLDQFTLSGNKFAPMWKAIFLSSGKGGYEANEESAKRLARNNYNDIVDAAKDGDAEALYLMFYEVMFGNAGLSSRKIAGSFLRKSAESGFLPAMYDYSIYLMNDNAYGESYRLLNKCYEQGMQLSAMNIGYLNEKGLGITKDVIRAIEWYKRGEIFGDPAALMVLARLHYTGGDDDFQPDRPKAIAYANKAAEANSTDAMNFLANIYLNGRNGVPKNTVKAISLYKQAAALGSNDAMTRLAYLYYYGSPDILRNEQMGISWAMKSAQLGGGECMELLSELYYEGKIGGKENIIKARFWANQALLHGAGKADNTATQARVDDFGNMLSNFDLRDQYSYYEDRQTGEGKIINDGPDLFGGLLSGLFGAVNARRANQQAVINGVEFIYSDGSKNIYGCTLTSQVKTTILLTRGDRIKINGYGSINFGIFAGTGNPNGITGFQNYCLDASIPHGAIMAGVGGKWLYIGSEKTYVAPADGFLQLAINDTDYSNNKGYFDLVVTIE